MTFTEVPWCWARTLRRRLSRETAKRNARANALNSGLHLMVRRAAIQNAQVHIGARGLREALEEVFDQFGLKIADAFSRRILP